MRADNVNLGSRSLKGLYATHFGQMACTGEREREAHIKERGKKRERYRKINTARDIQRESHTLRERYREENRNKLRERDTEIYREEDKDKRHTESKDVLVLPHVNQYRVLR